MIHQYSLIPSLLMFFSPSDTFNHRLGHYSSVINIILIWTLDKIPSTIVVNFELRYSSHFDVYNFFYFLCLLVVPTFWSQHFTLFNFHGQTRNIFHIVSFMFTSSSFFGCIILNSSGILSNRWQSINVIFITQICDITQ
jgi:hypothetical protein